MTTTSSDLDALVERIAARTGALRTQSILPGSAAGSREAERLLLEDLAAAAAALRAEATALGEALDRVLAAAPPAPDAPPT